MKFKLDENFGTRTQKLFKDIRIHESKTEKECYDEFKRKPD